MFAYCLNNSVCRKDISGSNSVAIFTGEGDVDHTDDDQDINGGKMPNHNGGLGNTVDSPSENVKPVNNGQKINPNQPASPQSNNKGWKVGQDISKPTRAGKPPSWTALRQRFWENEAYYHPEQYSEENLRLMEKGLAPRDAFGIPMELHHPYGRLGSNFYYFEPMTHGSHIKIHYGG